MLGQLSIVDLYLVTGDIAKVAQEKSNADIKKQFADIKSLVTINSSKFDEYAKVNDIRKAVVEANV